MWPKTQQQEKKYWLVIGLFKTNVRCHAAGEKSVGLHGYDSIVNGKNVSRQRPRSAMLGFKPIGNWAFTTSSATWHACLDFMASALGHLCVTYQAQRFVFDIVELRTPIGLGYRFDQLHQSGQHDWRAAVNRHHCLLCETGKERKCIVLSSHNITRWWRKYILCCVHQSWNCTLRTTHRWVHRLRISWLKVLRGYGRLDHQTKFTMRKRTQDIGLRRRG